MMPFSTMYNEQVGFQREMGDHLLTEPERVKRVEHMLMMAHSESADLLDALGYKTHKGFQRPDWDTARLEWIDSFKYLLAAAAIAGWDAGDLVHGFWDKSHVVRERFLRGQQELAQQPVVVFDIDGVLCAYEELTDQQEADGAYRNSKPNLLLCGFTRTVQGWGVKVVLVTSRKSYRHQRIAIDTELWLRENNVGCDRLLFSYDKAAAIEGLNVLCAVEDSPKHANAYAELGLPVFLVEGRARRDGEVLDPTVMTVDVIDVPVRVAQVARAHEEAFTSA